MYQIDDVDFMARFDGRQWKVEWKWRDDGGPGRLPTQAAEYKSAREHAEKVDAELSEWCRNGWLVPYHGTVRGNLPVMAVVQASKGKARPVFDLGV